MAKYRYGVAIACALWCVTGAAHAATTFVSGQVTSGTAVEVGRSADTDTQTSTTSAPGTITATSTSSVVDPSISTATVTATNAMSATWTSAEAGSVTTDWGWNLNNGMSALQTAVATNIAFDSGQSNWSYTFTTGAGTSVFSAIWNLSVSVPSGIAFGLQGIYGRGGSPFNISPFLVTPVSDSGSFSVNLSPFTTYTFGIANNGNRSSPSGRETVANASATLNWTITPGGPVIPEPSTWMLMILGFGLIAQQLRRRHQASTLPAA
jgi:hypothetical protein